VDKDCGGETLVILMAELNGRILVTGAA